jgi:hypothetical protein
MKNSILVALTLLAFQAGAFAQAKKAEPSAAPSTSKPAETAKPAHSPGKKDEDKATRPLPMHSRVDEIDAAGKTFTQNTREGKKVKHVITGKTEIKQGRDSAKFEDIKVGDMVSGSRLKKNAEGTEYEVIKITKFSAKAKTEEKK